ncbi:MAG: sugar ABC transporter ATP-binding protein, partial [Clostridia bacterium]
MEESQQAFLTTRNLSKSFTGNKVLFDVSLELRPGQYHALVGENGAGKSTLINLITGIYQHDEGTISINNKQYNHLTPLIARQLGIFTVHQELSINPVLTVAQNIFLGCEKLKGVFLDTREMNRLTVSLLSDVGLSYLRPDQDAGELSMAERQMLEFVKAIFQQPKLLVLDEATSALDDAQVKIVFDKLKELKKQGMMLLFISHRLHEVSEICDTMMVLKDGHQVITCGTSDYDEDGLVSLMTGSTVSNQFPPKIALEKVLSAPKVIEAEHISFSKTKDASFCLHKGEILGIGGLQGQGQQSFLEVLFGIKRITKGKLLLDGKPVTLSSPRNAMHYGIAYLPAERKVDGLFITHNIRFNTSFSSLELVSNKLGIILRKKEDKLCEDARDQFSIKFRTFQQLISELSGGNQQKIVLAKWLSRSPRLLLLNEPTRGIDVGTKHEIYEILHSLVKQGVSIVMISSDTIELLNL